MTGTVSQWWCHGRYSGPSGGVLAGTVGIAVLQCPVQWALLYYSVRYSGATVLLTRTVVSRWLLTRTVVTRTVVIVPVCPATTCPVPTTRVPSTHYPVHVPTAGTPLARGSLTGMSKNGKISAKRVLGLLTVSVQMDVPDMLDGTVCTPLPVPLYTTASTPLPVPLYTTAGTPIPGLVAKPPIPGLVAKTPIPVFWQNTKFRVFW